MGVFFVISLVHDILFVMPELAQLLFHLHVLIIVIISIIIIIINLCDDTVT